MDIKANVNLINRPEGNLKAIASISINDDFIVRGVRVLEGEKGLFVAMPSQKVGNEYRDVCFPKSAELRDQINSTVLEAYEQTLEKEQKNDEKVKKGQKRESGRTQKAGAGNKQAEADQDLQEGQDEQVEEGPVMSM